MNTSPSDFVTVDMRGLKTQLVSRARAERSSVSAVVRRAVMCELGLQPGLIHPPGAPAQGAGWVKLSIRFTRAEAQRLARAAKLAGMARGAYLAGLVDGVPILTNAGGLRLELIQQLIGSCSQLSTLSREVRQLTRLLAQGNVQRALEYRAELVSLKGDIERHLNLAAAALAALQGRGSPPDPSGGR